MDNITNSDMAIPADSLTEEVYPVLLPLLNGVWIHDRGAGTPNPFLQHSEVECLRHGVSNGGHSPSTCSSAARNCHDRTPLFAENFEDPFSDSGTFTFNNLLRIKPPIRMAGLLSVLLDSPCFPWFCGEILKPKVRGLHQQKTLHWSSKVR